MITFFDLIDVALVNSHTVYTKRDNDISLMNFKIVAAKALIGRYSNRKKLFPTSGPSKQKSHEPSIPIEVPTYMAEFQEKRMRCHYCKNECLDHKAFVFCQTCDLYVWLTKERNRFLKHHLQFSITIPLLVKYLLENRLFFFITDPVSSM